VYFLEKVMLSKKGKLIFVVVTGVCILGCIGFVYLGFVFFAKKQLVLWVYNIYIVGLTGVVIFMVHRYIKTYIP